MHPNGNGIRIAKKVSHWRTLTMIFMETPIFTRRAKELMGDVIEGTGRIRKIRVAAKGHGKRGGA